MSDGYPQKCAILLILFNWFMFFAFRYELDNGQFFQEAGKLNENGAQEVAGSYSFKAADGQTYWVKYTADEEGFHPIVGKLLSRG